ncbi:MAG: DegV family protein, partial [Chloroflexota bacterium]
MSKIEIVTDSVASIPETLAESLDIHSVPYYIHRGNKVLRDLVTVKHEAFYKWLPLEKELPKTACPGPGDYSALYEELAEQGASDILSIHISSKTSGAYQAATAAKEVIASRIPNLRIEVIDTMNASMCQGWVAIEAARASLSGMSMDNILEQVKSMIPRTHLIHTADTLRYLHLGGRIGQAKRLLGSVLNIKPLIGLENGVIVPLGQARSRKKAYAKMVDMIVDKIGPNGKIKIAYAHAAAQQEAEKLKAMVEERIEVVESFIFELSPALGVHTGPGTAGFSFYQVSQ